MDALKAILFFDQVHINPINRVLLIIEAAAIHYFVFIFPSPYFSDIKSAVP